MKVSIIGAGTVGQATGIGLEHYGHQVIFYDTCPDTLEQLATRGYRVAGAVRESNIHMICVPTPLNGDSFDLSFVEAAVKEVAQEIKGKNEYQLVVLRSTVLPFTTRTKVIPVLGECGVCYNPEFLRRANATEDFTNPPIVVIGEMDKRSGDVLAELYASFPAPQLRTSLENAEAIKCLSNVYNAMKVSFFNTVWLIAKECGLDHEVISEAMVKASLGVRVPEYYTRGGFAFDGNCLPKDLAASITFLKEHGLDYRLFQAVASVNEAMKK